MVSNSYNSYDNIDKKTANKLGFLHMAVKYNQLNDAKKMLNLGADINKRPRGGIYGNKTPLELAVIQRNPEIVRFLLNRGANPSAQNHVGRNAYHLAVERFVNNRNDERIISIINMIDTKRKEKAKKNKENAVKSKYRNSLLAFGGKASPAVASLLAMRSLNKNNRSVANELMKNYALLNKQRQIAKSLENKLKI